MAQRDFLFIPNLEEQAIDVDNALIEAEPPIYLSWALDGSSASPDAPKTATADFFIDGVSTFSVTATADPNGTDDLTVTLGTVSSGVTTQTLGSGSRSASVIGTHTKSGKKVFIYFYIIDFSGASGGSGK